MDACSGSSAASLAAISSRAHCVWGQCERSRLGRVARRASSSLKVSNDEECPALIAPSVSVANLYSDDLSKADRWCSKADVRDVQRAVRPEGHTARHIENASRSVK